MIFSRDNREFGVCTPGLTAQRFPPDYLGIIDVQFAFLIFVDIFFHPVCINVSASSDNFALIYKDSTDLCFVLNVY